MKCKFCGCTDHRPCFIPPSFVEDAVAGVPCSWLLSDVCTAPACVEKAYVEAWPLAEIIEARLELVA